MQILDDLQIIFWSITYVLIIIFSFKNIKLKCRAIPIIAVVFNFAWEFNALVMNGHWGHYVWLTLDVIILAFALITVREKKFIISDFIFILISLIVFNVIFWTLSWGMLISSFVIDLTMAIGFYVRRKYLLHDGKIVIGIIKLLGDLFAWIYYSKFTVVVAIIGAVVFAFNLLYVMYAIKEYKEDNINKTNLLA